MNSSPDAASQTAFTLAIIGGFCVFFPIMWCSVVWLLSRVGGWHRLAQRYASGDRPVTGERYSGRNGHVGVIRYGFVLILHFNDEGFFLDVMKFYRIGHPRLFIHWSDVEVRKPRLDLWGLLEVRVGQPFIATVSLSGDLIRKHMPPDKPVLAK